MQMVMTLEAPSKVLALPYWFMITLKAAAPNPNWIRCKPSLTFPKSASENAL